MDIPTRKSKEALAQVVQADAVAECSRSIMNAYAILMTESAQALLGLASDTQEFVNEQLETSARSWQQAGDVARNFIDATSIVFREIEARSIADQEPEPVQGLWLDLRAPQRKP